MGQYNVLAIRVENSKQPNSQWYSVSSIFRHIWLSGVNPVHVDLCGTFVTTSNFS